MKTAVCDPDAFYPLTSLVSGPLESLADLAEIERFVRTVVLHDQMLIELEPLAYDREADFEVTEEERCPGGRNVITAIGPALTGYDFFTECTGREPVPEIELAPALVELASKSANAGAGSAYFETHIQYLKRVLGIVTQGGSALLCGAFGRQAIATTEKYPESLFRPLDEEWQRHAQSAQQEGLGLLVRPVLGIVLTRCARRDEIPRMIRDLRDEWAAARRKTWELLDALRMSKTVGEFVKLQSELSEASRLFSLEKAEFDSRPARILWEIVAAAAAGASIAQLSGGKPAIGAVTGAIAQLAHSVPAFGPEFGRVLFGRGAFDLAKRVRREAAQVEFDALPRLLTDAEKRKLGFR